MFLVNFLNRNITDPLFPLFEIIYVIELTTLLCAIVLGIALMFSSWFIRYHINIRLRLICSIFHGILYPVSRIVVIWHEYFGPVDNGLQSRFNIRSEFTSLVEHLHIVICGQIKQAFLGYFTTLIAILAIDRLVATRYWAWYERGQWQTLLFSFLQETCLTVIANVVGAALFFTSFFILVHGNKALNGNCD